MKTILSICLISMMYISSQAQNSVFDTGIENNKKLPALEIIINEDDIAKAFLSKQIFASTETSNEYIYENQSAIFYEDPKINDTKNLFEKYLKRDLLTNTGDYNGSIEMKILYHEYKFDVSPGFFINVATFGITGLFGLPTERYQSNIELETNIYNLNNELIASYYISGKDNYFKNLYRKRITDRESNLRALKKAINNLNENIVVDYDTINEKLLSANQSAMK